MEGVTMLSGSSSPTSTTSLTSATVTRAAVAMTTLKRSEEHTSELQSRSDLVCRLLLEKKKKKEDTAKFAKKQIYHKKIASKYHVNVTQYYMVIMLQHHASLHQAMRNDSCVSRTHTRSR